MQHRGMVICTIWTTVFLLASVVSGIPVEEGFLQINKEVPNSPQGSSPERDVDVEELHSLDSSNKNSEIMNPTDFPGQVNRHASRLKTADEEKRSPDSKSDFVLSDFTSSSDTPRDMAEYIFWTGDETSVTNAIKDFINQGLISVEDGQEFMEQVRYDLQRIQFRYGSDDNNAANPEVLSETTKYLTKEDEEDPESRQLSELVAPPANKVAEIEKPHEGEIVVTSYRLNPKSAIEPVHQVPTTVTVQKDEESNQLKDEIKMRGTLATGVKEEHLNEANIVDILSNEYSLEEILYQLARILFSQSLSQAGHPEAEEALKKFADFLEKESKEGKMSPQLQKKVLDVLLMSLFDSMADHQHIIPTQPPAKLSTMEHVLIANKDKH
ncbi:hypothetical protein DAPPUDRAFT_252076 [Daphnia pulex]|uniref:Secretogranin III n=1 Tax=Daphnia pulex TaxID=6669 RepID=E9H1W0_DAPPU|nr:hypothetical protein DAPPUDRAFT_252076 [Daphnia pulex]|eukprot:EFX74242.1 hypothetical protein DAPPUDRAFT_252076 [Daphnia pulex]